MNFILYYLDLDSSNIWLEVAVVAVVLFFLSEQCIKTYMNLYYYITNAVVLLIVDGIVIYQHISLSAWIL